MALLKLVIAPDPRLLMVSRPVERVDKELQRFMDDMLETMHVEKGVGLAAVQVGVLKRVLIFDPSSYLEKECDPIYMINPDITFFSEQEYTRNEGCLSFPLSRVDVTRPENIKVKFLDYYGKEQEMHAEGWVATGIQHEMDHLNGIVQLNYVSKLKQDSILRKLKKYKKLNNL